MHKSFHGGYGLGMNAASSESSGGDGGTPNEDPAETTDMGIDDSQLPEDLRPGPDNPLASPDEKVSEAAEPDRDDAVPEGEGPPGEPSIG
jgi:hypothetical protein